MLLRRLGEALANQNWFVVIIEVLVVVDGIFIVLQVDDWSDYRSLWMQATSFTGAVTATR